MEEKNYLQIFAEVKEDFEKGGIQYILDKTKNQEQNPKYHSFNVGIHREKVEEAIQEIIKQDEDAAFLNTYGYKHDLIKGYTTTYKNGFPQELKHDQIGYEFLKIYSSENKYLLFCVKNHHKLSSMVIEEDVGVNGYGEINEETNVKKLTQLTLKKVQEGEIKKQKGFDNIINKTVQEFKNKKEVLIALKLLGYALLADALGGFKKEIAVSQFWKAKQLIRIEEYLNITKILFFEEDKEFFKEKLLKEIKETKELNTPKNWDYDLEIAKEEALKELKEKEVSVGSDYESLAISYLKKYANIQNQNKIKKENPIV